MKKTNFFKKAMVLLGASLFALTTFTSCSEKEDITPDKTTTETKGQTGEYGCRPTPQYAVIVRAKVWEFVTITPQPPSPPCIETPRAPLGPIPTTFYVNDVPVGCNAANIKTLVNNSQLVSYSVPFGPNTPSSNPSISATWYNNGSNCRTIMINVYNINSSVPVGFYIEFTTI